MKAILIYQKRRQFLTQSGRIIVVQMDLFEIQGETKNQFPGGYKFSWVAFDSLNPDERVLFDSHPPKGPHFHADGDKDGVSFEWKSVNEAEAFFQKKITEKFGEIT